jgi:hypothetical protein
MSIEYSREHGKWVTFTENDADEPLMILHFYQLPQMTINIKGVDEKDKILLAESIHRQVLKLAGAARIGARKELQFALQELLGVQ